MNDSSPPPAMQPLPLKPRWIAVGLCLLLAYVLLRPWLVERYGWDLPGFSDLPAKPGATATVESGRASRPGDRNRPVEVPVVPEQDEPVVEKSDAASKSQERTANDTKAGSPAEVTASPPANAEPAAPASRSQAKKNSPKAKPPAQESSAAWEGLKSVGRGKFESPAGLVYDDYRIDHVMEHTRDNTDKPSHGVFDVTKQDEVLALIDEAFDLTKKRGPPQVVTEDEGERTAYTVNLNRKVGHAGGQSGARRRHPPLQKVKIVVEEKRVITAYPTN